MEPIREQVYKCHKCKFVGIGKYFKWNKRLGNFELYCKKCLKIKAEYVEFIFFKDDRIDSLIKKLRLTNWHNISGIKKVPQRYGLVPKSVGTGDRFMSMKVLTKENAIKIREYIQAKRLDDKTRFVWVEKDLNIANSLVALFNEKEGE